MEISSVSGELVTAVITLAGTIVVCSTTLLAAIWKTHGQARDALRHAREANDAINHRHDPESPRAFDMLAKMYQTHGLYEPLIKDWVSWRAQIDKWMKSQDYYQEEHIRVHERIEKKLNECLPSDGSML